MARKFIQNRSSNKINRIPPVARKGPNNQDSQLFQYEPPLNSPFPQLKANLGGISKMAARGRKQKVSLL
jgi:hypothetical protein